MASPATSYDRSSVDEKDIEKQDSPSPNPSRSTSHTADDRQQADTGNTNGAPLVITDWDGPLDQGNPLNWPKAKKIYHAFIPAMIAFVCTIASSIYTPGRYEVRRDFRVSEEVALLPYVFYILGLGFGPLVAAPLSETLGRRAVYVVSIPIFALFTLGSGFSKNMGSLAVCRFLSGIFGSPGLSIGSATLSDIWQPAERAVPMALYVVTPFLGPAIGPVVGGYAATAKGWQWTMWVLLMFTAVCLTPCLFMKETYKPALLRRRAKQRGASFPGSDQTVLQATRKFVRSTLSRPLRMAFTEPVVGLLTLYVGVNFGVLYGFFAALPYVFEKKYGFGTRKVGLTFLGLGVGAVIGAIIIIVFAKAVFMKHAIRAKKAGKKPSPEIRLYPAMVGSVCLTVSLFWFAWSAQEAVHWICPVIAEAVYGLGNFLIFMSATLYIMDFYGPAYGASAMAANTLIRYTIGAVFPLFTKQMFERLGTGWALSLLGFIGLALSTIPFIFYKMGPKLRQHSSYIQE